MKNLTEQHIRNLLAEITNPISGRDKLSDDMIKSVEVNDQNISIVVEIDQNQAEEIEKLI